MEFFPIKFQTTIASCDDNDIEFRNILVYNEDKTIQVQRLNVPTSMIIDSGLDIDFYSTMTKNYFWAYLIDGELNILDEVEMEENNLEKIDHLDW